MIEVSVRERKGNFWIYHYDWLSISLTAFSVSEDKYQFHKNLLTQSGSTKVQFE